MKINISYDIDLKYSRLVVCELVTDGVEHTLIASCKRRKAEWHTTRLLLHEICPDAAISYGANGEPILENSAEFTHLSISHGANKVAILLSTNDCGVDIESTTRNFNRVATRFLNERERSIIVPKHYPMAWSAKEAIFKYLKGNGIEFLTDFEITAFEDDKIEINHRGKAYVISIINGPNYILAYI